MNKLKGSCLCGLIKYEVKAIESRMGHCHCSMCRKFHGAAFATLGEAKVDNFRWVAGKSHLKTYLGGNGTVRKFCENCGSSLIFVPSNDDGKLVEFSLGTLDTEITERPDAHVFINSKPNWSEVNDDLPKFDRGRKN